MTDSTPLPHLLLVEDDASFLNRLHKNLEASHFKITSVGSVEHALPLVDDGNFDLILTDIRLPGATVSIFHRSAQR